jgi:diacylglycerol kinase (ATP)
VVAPSSTPVKRAAVIYNPLKVDLPRLKKTVAAAAQRARWADTIWLQTTEAETGHGLGETAVRRGVTVVLVAGGDGTVRAVAGALRGTGIPLALVPSGTGNLLARNLELPLSNLESSVELAFSGADRPIDLGLARITRADGHEEEHAFIVMAGLGLDAKMIKNTSSRLKKAVGWLAYIDGIARSLPELKPVRVRYRLGGGSERSMTVHTIIIGNCGVLPGGFLLMPDAKPDDGILDIAALRPRGPLGWLAVWRKVAWDNGVLRKSAIGRKIIDLSRDVKGVTYLTGRTLEIAVVVPQDFQLDGDEFGEAQAVTVWLDDGALIVKVAAP